MATTRLAKKSGILRVKLRWFESIKEWGFEILPVRPEFSLETTVDDIVSITEMDDVDFDDFHVWAIVEGWTDQYTAEQWILDNFPTFTKIGDQYYHPTETEEVVSENGTFHSYHPIDGALFRQHRETTEGVTNTRYVVMDEDLEALKAIAGVVNDGAENNTFFYALVRRRTPAGWKYYPLPLIYASPEERELAARSANTTPPPERWVRRRRKAVELLLERVTKS